MSRGNASDQYVTFRAISSMISLTRLAAGTNIDIVKTAIVGIQALVEMARILNVENAGGLVSGR